MEEMDDLLKKSNSIHSVVIVYESFSNDEKLGWAYQINWEIIQNKNEELGTLHSVKLSEFQAEHFLVTEDGLKDESAT